MYKHDLKNTKHKLSIYCMLGVLAQCVWDRSVKRMEICNYREYVKHEVFGVDIDSPVKENSMEPATMQRIDVSGYKQIVSQIKGLLDSFETINLGNMFRMERKITSIKNMIDSQSGEIGVLIGEGTAVWL